jgi:hypothetical protein
MIAATEAGQHKKRIPQIKLATALLLFRGGNSQPDGVEYC